MEIQEGRFDSDSKVDEDMAEFCNGMSGSMQVSRIACWSGSGGSRKGRAPSIRPEDWPSIYRSSRTTTRRDIRPSGAVSSKWSFLTSSVRPPKVPFAAGTPMSPAEARKVFSPAAAASPPAATSVNTTRMRSRETAGPLVPAAIVKVLREGKRTSSRWKRLVACRVSNFSAGV